MSSTTSSAKGVRPLQPPQPPSSVSASGASPASPANPQPAATSLHASPATPSTSPSFSHATAAAAAAVAADASTATAAAAEANAAVAMDPAALWAALDLPAPESLPSQHTARRVLLLGRPLSGKRTLCRRLRCAAEAQYAAAVTDADVEEEDRLGAGGAADNGRQPLYRPASSDDEDAAILPHAQLGGWNMPGAFSAAGALQDGSGGGGPAGGRNAANTSLSHGSGVSFDFVVQRVPTRVARADNNNNSGGGTASGERGCGDTSTAAAAARRASAAVSAAQTGGTVRRTTEFFCCDSPGALSMALPTIADLESAVVLIVVDVSDISTIRQQLDASYATLHAYVASLLRIHAPATDEVRRLQLAAAQQDYWFAEEQKMRTTRVNLASSVAGAKDSGRGDVLFKDPMANLDKVNSTTFRIPASAGTVSPMRTIIVCTKAEGLERASRAIGTLDSAGGGSDNDGLFHRLGVTPELAVALRRSRLSLMALVSQIIRHTAIHRRAAVACLSQRVNMTTAGAEGEYAGSALVNPFYKGLWSYIAYMLYSSGDANGCPSSDVLRVCSARVYPHALLPCGLDAPGLLSPFVTADPAQLADLLNSSGEDAAESAIRTTAEDVRTPDGVFALHQRYLQAGQGESLSGAWGQTDGVVRVPEDTAMVWDTM